MKKSRSLGRLAHEGRVNRVGQAWSQDKALVFNDFGETSLLPVDHFHCKSKACGAVVRVDERGFAFCEKCGEIYNDGLASPPRVYDRRQRDFFRSVKA